MPFHSHLNEVECAWESLCIAAGESYKPAAEPCSPSSRPWLFIWCPLPPPVKSEQPLYLRFSSLCSGSFSGGVLMTPQLHKSQTQHHSGLLLQPLRRSRRWLQEPLLPKGGTYPRRAPCQLSSLTVFSPGMVSRSLFSILSPSQFCIIQSGNMHRRGKQVHCALYMDASLTGMLPECSGFVCVCWWWAGIVFVLMELFGDTLQVSCFMLLYP